MSWRDFDNRPYIDSRDNVSDRTTPLRTNEVCFLRRQHRCEKVFAASKSCFVACPTDDSLEPLLALLEAKLAAHGIEAVIAVKERAYGQDIVCTKICGKIIESRFCVVILDETDKLGVSVANPNVYYEYGLMTALRKNIIPLQRDGLPLAFNIQSQDTVKYTPKNMADELERAIRNAISETEPGQQSEDQNAKISAQRILRRFELAGFERMGRDHKAYESTQDTMFMPFTSNRGGYLFLAKIDNAKEVQNAPDDIQVLVHRLNALRKFTEELLTSLPRTIQAKRLQLEEIRNNRTPYTTRAYDLERELLTLENSTPTLERRLSDLIHSHVGFIASPGLETGQLVQHINTAIEGTPFIPVWNEGMVLRIGEVSVELSDPTHACPAAMEHKTE